MIWLAISIMAATVVYLIIAAARAIEHGVQHEQAKPYPRRFPVTMQPPRVNRTCSE